MSTQNESETKTQDRRAYTTPQLQVFGEIAEMTDEVNPTSGTDFTSMKMASLG